LFTSAPRIQAYLGNTAMTAALRVPPVRSGLFSRRPIPTTRHLTRVSGSPTPAAGARPTVLIGPRQKGSLSVS
jgi:hypothetical protein